jgi:hypothetical protein
VNPLDGQRPSAADGVERPLRFATSDLARTMRHGFRALLAVLLIPRSSRDDRTSHDSQVMRSSYACLAHCSRAAFAKMQAAICPRISAGTAQADKHMENPVGSRDPHAGGGVRLVDRRLVATTSRSRVSAQD